MMKLRISSYVIYFLILSFPTVMVGSPTGFSIGINFAADEPNGAGSAVSGPAGVLGTKHWNNVVGSTSDDIISLVTDVNGNALETDTFVEWTAAGTWSSDGRGEDLNDAPDGDNRNLMLGYLDTDESEPSVVSVIGLDHVFVENRYDVYLYIQGGVSGRGGQYSVDFQTQQHDVTSKFTGEFVEGPEGNYLLFEDLENPAFDIEARPLRGDTKRAPINAIEIVSRSEGIRGDFNENGMFDAEDITLLTRELFEGGKDLKYDANGDGVLDFEDRLNWVENTANTYFGDSNLDGVFNTTDFVVVFQKGQFEDETPLNSGWGEGDWNGDLEFTTSDFVFVFQQGGYERGPRRVTAAVPEPTNVFFFAGLCLIMARRCRRQ